VNIRLIDAFQAAAALEVGVHIGLGAGMLLTCTFNPAALLAIETMTAGAALARGAYVYCNPRHPGS
jgi:hypothetical protein